MHVYIYIYIYICVCVYISKYIYTYTYTYECIHVYVLYNPSTRRLARRRWWSASSLRRATGTPSLESLSRGSMRPKAQSYSRVPGKRCFL